MPQVHLFISGQVQGVLFRMHAHKKATSLKLTGWVRNLGDGRVEILAEGEPEILENFVDWCHQGPPAAQVENVEAQWHDEEENSCRDFRITG